MTPPLNPSQQSAEQNLSNTPSNPTLDDAALRTRPPGDESIPSGDVGATLLPADSQAPRVGPTSASFAGYEVLEELGRGGMGVVYKARQLKADRIVALKMILTGGLAGEAELTRFRTEAQALARLQHPNIVQVYDVGEYDSRPYFSLEFCPFGSLDKQLKAAPLPPMDAARLVETLARAMHAAHQAQVIHRDLKPANVLLAAGNSVIAPREEMPGKSLSDSRYKIPNIRHPKITDFGLAKKLDDAGQTHSGAVMGTPSYMAPEQAAGRTQQIGPSADIYALGAILYECLTGRPPFKAATVPETLYQVLHDEPAPPSHLQSKTPVDLETVCLKCLQKEPAKRYLTAEDLAADLARFQRGEPIAARPVNRLERTWRWCKRNPALAASLTAVAVSLVLGTAVATMFAIQAGLARDDERDAKFQAQSEEAKAIKARNELATANSHLLTTAAQSLFGPWGVQIQPFLPIPALNEHEIRSLWTLASTKDPLLRTRLIEEALQDQTYMRQLKDRAAFVLHAAVGLETDRRKHFERLLGEYLLAKKDLPAHPEHVALSLTRLGAYDRSFRSKAVAVLMQAMSKKTSTVDWQELVGGISLVAPLMEPEDASESAVLILQAMRQAVTEGRVEDPLPYLAQAMAAVAPRLALQEAAETCGVATALLAQALSQTTNAQRMRSLSEGLSTLADYLDLLDSAKTRRRAAAILAKFMTTTQDSGSLIALSQGVLALTARLKPQDASSACGQGAAILLLCMNQDLLANHLRDLLDPLAALASRLEPNDAARICGLAATSFVQARLKKKDLDHLQLTPEGLSALLPHLAPKEAGDVAAILAETFGQSTSEGCWSQLAQSLSVLAVRLESRAAAMASAALLQAMEKTTNASIRSYLARALQDVGARLEHEQAVESARALHQLLNKTSHRDLTEYTAACLSSIAGRLDSALAAEIAESLAEQMTNTSMPKNSRPLAACLATVATRLEPNKAAIVCGRAAALLDQAISSKTLAVNIMYQAEGLSALAARLTPQEANRLCGSAVTKITQRMLAVEGRNDLEFLTQGLRAVAVHVEPGRAVAAFAQAMSKVNAEDYAAWWPLTVGMASVAGRLVSKDASIAADAILQSMSRATEPAVLLVLAKALAAVAPRLEPNAAARACSRGAAALFPVIAETTHPDFQAKAAIALAALAAHLEPREAAQVCDRAAAVLAQAMRGYSDLPQWPNLLIVADGLCALTLHMEAEQATRECSRAASLLINAMGLTIDPHSTRMFLQLISAFLNREPLTVTHDRILNVVASTAMGPLGTPFVTLTYVLPAVDPLPVQLLAELLKHPLCVGEPRRLILDQLSRHYGRPFKDQWEFVAYIRQERLPLDLTSPPSRP